VAIRLRKHRSPARSPLINRIVTVNVKSSKREELPHSVKLDQVTTAIAGETPMFSNRLSTEQIARCHAESRKAIGRRIGSIYETDLSTNLPDRLERLLDELCEVDAHSGGRVQK
jgi:hypothetical protein